MLQRSLIRLARVVVAGAFAGGIAAGINAVNSGALDGTTLAGFVVIITSALTAADKFVRDFFAKDTADAPSESETPAPTETK